MSRKGVQPLAVAQHRELSLLLDDEDQWGTGRARRRRSGSSKVPMRFSARPPRFVFDGSASCCWRCAAGGQRNQGQCQQDDARVAAASHDPRYPAAYFFSTTSPLSLTSVSRSAELIFTEKEPPELLRRRSRPWFYR